MIQWITQHKNKLKILFFIFITILLMNIWHTSFLNLNTRLAAMDTHSFKIYSNTADWIPFGDNYLMANYMNGAFARIEKTRIVDIEDYLKELGDHVDAASLDFKKSDHVLEVELTLKNENDTDLPIDLLALILTGEDFHCTMEPDWLYPVNNFKGAGIGGILIPSHSELLLKIPFWIDSRTYREKFKRTLETEPLWLSLTGYPETVKVKLR